MKDQEYMVACPLCGKMLMKGKMAVGIEMICPRCNNRLGIVLENDRVIISKQQTTVQTAKG